MLELLPINSYSLAMFPCQNYMIKWDQIVSLGHDHVRYQATWHQMTLTLRP